MLYIIIFAIFFFWAIYAIRKKRMSWHVIFGIYILTLFWVDYGDVPFDHWLNLYDINVYLLEDLDAGRYLGIILSDGIIFPLIAIVFCYYASKCRRLWLLSFLFAGLLGIIELILEKTGYIIYHHWNHWITPLISFFSLRLLACFSDRLIHYSPPISYRFRLVYAIYAIVEWPGAILGGSLRLFYFRPYIFENETFDNRFVAMILTTVMGAIAAILITKVPRKFRIFLFFGLASFSIIFALWMHSRQMLIYNHWNTLLVVLRYIIPYLLVYLYDRWEWPFTVQSDPKKYNRRIS